MAEAIVTQLVAAVTSQKPTLCDVIKDFHILVKNHDREIASNITSVLEQFQSSSNLVKLLKVKLINKYRVRSEVFKLLQSGDSLGVSQALKCHWFFDEIEDPEKFVNEFIPGLSLSARLKVLNKYAAFLKNIKSAEAVYEGLKSRYGIRTAISMIPACGENFIRNEFPNIKIALPPSIVLALFKKYPSLTTEYIKYLAADTRKCRDLSSYESVLVKLASTDVNTFLELAENYTSLPRIQLGRRPTKKLLKSSDAKVLNNYSNFRWLLNSKTFFTRLSINQIKALYVSDLLPSDVSQFLSGSRLALINLKFVKPDLRSDLLLTTFKSKYGRDITADAILYNLEDIWIDYLPLESKIKWLESKIQKNASDVKAQAKYVAQLPIESSMPRLRKLIESQSNADIRVSIAKNMMETVKINQCPGAIKELFAYFVRRFRNETPRFRSAIVSGMDALDKLFLGLEIEDWLPIIDFINIMKLNHEVYQDFSTENILIKVMDFRVQNCFMKNGNVENCLNDYLALGTGDNKSVNYQVLKLCENTPYRPFCLEWLLNAVPKLKWAEVDFEKGFHAQLYEHLSSYNMNRPDSKIKCPEWLHDSVRRIVQNTENGFYNVRIIRESAKRSGEMDFWRDIMKEYAFKQFGCETMCEILKFEPSFILRNIHEIMEHTMNMSFDTCAAFYKKTRLYDPFGIPSAIAKICLINLKLENPEFDVPEDSFLYVVSSQPHAVRALSVVSSSSEFLQIAARFAPTTSQVTDYSEENQALHDLQNAVCKSFVDVSSAVDVLPVLQKFAVGDYLKFVSGSLTSVCVKIPENRVLPMLKESVDCPVSLRKHYLKLLYNIAPAEERVGLFVNIFKSEKNVSLRLVLFQQLRKAFIDEPDEDTYRTFHSVLNQLTVVDEEAVKELFDIKHINDDFVGRYLETIWGLVGSKWSTLAPDGRTTIRNLVTCKEMRLLTEEFCSELMSSELMDKLPDSSPSAFASLYLLHAPTAETQAVRLSKVMASLRPLIQSCWNEYKFTEGRVFVVRYIVSDFVQTLCLDAQTHVGCLTVHPVQILEHTKQNLSNLIAPPQFLRESFQLDLAVKQLQHRRSNLSPATFVTTVVDLYKMYLQIHNQLQYPIVKCLIECAPNDIKADLALALIGDGNETCQIIGIELLSSHLSNEEAVPVYKTVIDCLSTSENPNIQATAATLFKSLTSSII